MPSLTPEDWARIRFAYEHSDQPIPDICAEYRISTGTLRDRMRRWDWTRRRQPIPLIGPAPLTPAPAMTAPPLAGFGDGALHAHEDARESARVAQMQEAVVRPDARQSENAEPKNDATANYPVLTTPPAAQAQETDADAAAPASRIDLRPLAADDNTDTAPPVVADASLPYSRFIAQEAKARGETADGASLGEQLRGAIARIMPAIERTLATLSGGPLQPRQMELTARSLGALTRTLRELNGLLAQHATDEWEPRDMEAFRRSLVDRINAIIQEREEDEPRVYHAAWEEFAAQVRAGAASKSEAAGEACPLSPLAGGGLG